MIKYTVYNIKYKIKTIVNGISNLYRWRKTIYHDRDWDYTYIYEILKTKLKFQAEYLLKHGHHVNSAKDAKQILECIDLIDKVQNEYYIDEALKKEKWDLVEMEAAEEKHNQARKQLFQMLSENIEGWWD